MSAIKIKKNSDYKLKTKNRRTKKPYEKKQYQVEQLRERNHDKFLVKWKDCKETENSWIDAKDISPDLINDYMRSPECGWAMSDKHENAWTNPDQKTAEIIESMYKAWKLDNRDYYLTTTTKNNDGSVVSVEHKFQFGPYIVSAPTNNPDKISVWKRIVHND